MKMYSEENFGTIFQVCLERLRVGSWKLGGEWR